jgi:uncharacterized protein (TIGR02231 family)
MTDFAAPIHEVTVYPDRALVTRRGRTELEAGEHQLEIGDLPMFLRESVRAAGRGPAGTRILGVDVATAFHGRAPEPDLATLRDRLEQQLQQWRLLEARKQSLDDRGLWLRGLGEQSRDFARGLAGGQMKPQDCADFFRFMSEQALGDAQEAEALRQEMTRLGEEIEATRREIDRNEGGKLPDRLVATVTVALAEPGDVELDLSYVVQGAAWEPQYDLRTQLDGESDEGTVELTMAGIVRQRTGERWAGAALILSTARPSVAARLPELDPWYLRVPEAPVPVMRQRTAALSEGFAAGAARRGAEPPVPAQPDQAPVLLEQEVEVETAIMEEAGPAVSFRVGHDIDIPSDGAPHKTTIDQRSLPCRMDRVTAPVVDQHAHIRAEVTNEAGHVLLPGPASVFHGPDYVGTVRLAHTAPGGTFDAYLGIDDRLEVERELTERAVDRGTILQGDIRRTTYGYRINLRNRADGRCRVVVRDRLPVSQHERVKVKLLSIRPEPSERTGLELTSWALDLEPGEERSIEYRFSVEQPAGLQVRGLPPT